MFDQIARDEVYVHKKSGERSGPFKSVLAKDSVTIFDDSLDVDEGDKVLRELPNGKVESYTVLEASFNLKFHSIPSHYQLDLRKDSSLMKALPPSTTTINIQNSTGFQIGDHNTQTIVNAFSQLISELDNCTASKEEKSEAKSKIKALLTNPTVASVLGGAAGGLLGML